jgi:hypothetical protein
MRHRRGTRTPSHSPPPAATVLRPAPTRRRLFQATDPSVSSHPQLPTTSQQLGNSHREKRRRPAAPAVTRARAPATASPFPVAPQDKGTSPIVICRRSPHLASLTSPNTVQKPVQPGQCKSVWLINRSRASGRGRARGNRPAGEGRWTTRRRRSGRT